MKRIIIVAIAIVGAVTLYAQEGGLKKQVEVTKDYMPDIERAAKLGIVPKMVDTVTLRPEISYSIRPSAWLGAFGVQAISPVRVNAASYSRQNPFYVKVGGGYPLHSLLDFYGTTVGNASGIVGGYVNHSGQYADIRNDADRDAQALQTNNSVGVFGAKLFRRMSLEGELGYDYNVYSRYGEFKMEGMPLVSYGDNSVMQSYSTPRARVSFGNPFTDLSYFNVRLGAEIYHMTDRFSSAETGISGFLELGKMFSIHKVYLKAEAELYDGAKELDYYADAMFKLSPRYEIVTNLFKMAIGGNFVVDKLKEQGPNMWFFPDFKMTFDVTSGYFVPFIDLNGQLSNNGYRNTALQNPYIAVGVTMPNMAEYNLRAGVSGSFNSAFSYRAYVGASLYEDMSFLANEYMDSNTASFVLPKGLTDRVTMFTIGAEIDSRISGSFTLTAAAHYYGYTLKSLEKAADRPNFDASLGVRYNYRDRVAVSLGSQFLASRYFYEFSPTVAEGSQSIVMNKVSPVVNLNLDVDVKVNHMVGLFFQGRNLANSKLYQFNHYPSVGISGAVGVKLLF